MKHDLIKGIDIDNLVINYKDNDTGEIKEISPELLVREAIQAEGVLNRFERELNNFSKHFLALAEQCGDPETFVETCHAIEYKMRWGTKPAGWKGKGEWRPQPRTWKSCKSVIYRAWLDYKIAPNKTLRNFPHYRKHKNEHGHMVTDLVHGTVVADSYAKIRELQRAARDASDSPSQPSSALLDDEYRALTASLDKDYLSADPKSKKKIINRIKNIRNALNSIE